MFIRPCYKKSKGKRLAYWALVESYRTAKGPRQRVVAYLGKIKESKRKGIIEIRKRCVTRPTEHQEILLQNLGLKIPLQFVKK